MCSDMVKKEVVPSDALFDYAKEKGLTLQGEMFSGMLYFITHMICPFSWLNLTVVIIISVGFSGLLM